MTKICKHCCIELTQENVANKNSKYWRNECKKCRSKQVSNSMVGNPRRHTYMREYVRRVGIVKQYQCETCKELCYKKYSRAFCSDVCRFMAYVSKQEECWVWTGKKNRRGYGKLCFRGNNSAIASRVSYMLFRGEITDNKLVCHTCDNPSCVNPKHLWLGTLRDNTNDMLNKGRQRSKLKPNDVFIIRKMWHEGKTGKDIMKLYDLTSGSISSIVNRRIWKHI